MSQHSAEGAASIGVGAAAGTWVSVTVGGMGLSFSGTAVSIGMTPMAVAGAVTGAAGYGIFKAIVEGDAAAIAAATAGGLGGAGVSVTVGGMGLAFKGTAVSLGIAPVTVAGAVVGLAIYGILKILDQPGSRESPAQVFARMEEKVLWQEAYTQALLELDPELSELYWKQRFAALEAEEELEALKAQMFLTTNANKEIRQELNLLTGSKWESSDVKVEFTEFKQVEFSFTKKSLKSQSSTDYSTTKSTELNIDSDSTVEPSSIEHQPIQAWQCVNTLKVHSGSVNSIDISSDNQFFVSGSNDKTVCLWNLKTGKLLYTFHGQGQEVSSVAINPDGKMLASGSFDQKVSIWNLNNYQFIQTYFYLNSGYSHSGLVYALAFSPDGKILASSSADKIIRLWERSTGKIIRTLNGHADGVLSIAFTPDSEIIASGSIDKTIKLWRVSDGKEILTLRGHSGWVNSVAISPDSKILASSSTDCTINLWNLYTGELISTLGEHSTSVFSICFSPDGKTIASGSNHDVKIWSLSNKELIQTISGSYPIAISPDGETLITGGEKNSVKIWHQGLNTVESNLNSVLSGEWWEVLGVLRTTPVHDVKLAYRRLARKYHPDINESVIAQTNMQAINAAYEKFQKESS